MEIILRKILKNDEEVFLKAINNPKWENNFDFAGNCFKLSKGDFRTYLNLVENESLGIDLPSGHVPCTWLFAFSPEGEIVGRVSIRHELNENLLKYGGHVGYGVVPEFRRHGIATKILKKSLVWIKENLPAIDRILLTCDKDNLGSIAIIKQAGGVQDSSHSLHGNSFTQLRFWINIL